MARRFLCITTLALLLVLVGCGVTQTKTETALPAATGNIQADPQYIFAVDKDSSENVLAAAKLFCEKAWELSGGGLSVGVVEFDNAHRAVLSGEAAFAISQNRDIRMHSECFDAFLAPFIFKDYSHFTMSANYQPLLDTINNNSEGIRVIAGYYAGTSYFLAKQPLEDQQQLLGLFFDTETVPVALAPPGSSVIAGLGRIGFEVIEMSSANERLEQLENDKAVLAEFTVRELIDSSEWLNSGLSFINVPNNFGSLWFVCSEPLYSELNSKQKAAMIEANSYLFPLLDESSLRDESRILFAISEQGFKTSGLPEVFRVICDSAYFDGFSPSVLRVYAAGQISEIRR